MVYRGLAFQGSDRRLSINSNGVVEPASDRANKSVVVSTSEALAMVGYTGLAELQVPGYGLVQMDSYIAGAASHGFDRWQPPSADNDLGYVQMGQVVMRIRDRLNALHGTLVGRERRALKAQMVQVVGFRRNRRQYAEPFSFVVAWDSDVAGFRHHNERLFVSSLASPQVTMTPDRGLDVRRRVETYLGEHAGTPDSVFGAFAKALAGFGGYPGVGGDYLLLCLEPLAFTVHTYFVSRTGESPVLETPHGDVPVHPLPWLVAPGVAQHPMLSNLGTAGGGSGVKFRLHGLPEWDPSVHDGRLPAVALGMDRARVVGSQCYSAPPTVFSSSPVHLKAGTHRIEMRVRPRPERHL